MKIAERRVPYSKMPPEAADVLCTIRWWTRKTGRPPTLRTLKCVCEGHPVATERGLDWLKDAGLVTWEPEGAGTRYGDAFAPSSEVAA